MTTVSNQSCCPYLPDDLLPEILSRSSVKSLLRFRCVSNLWLNCINDPKFARLHLIRYNKDDAESYLCKQLARIFYSDPEYVLRCGKTLRTTGSLYSEPSRMNVLFVFDGLIMLSIGGEVMIRNEWIRKSRRIPKCPEIQRGQSVFNFGIGFSSAINDYKYVIMCRTYANYYLEFFAVYTLGTNSWKTFEFPIHGYTVFKAGGSKPVCVGGFMYAINWGTPDVLSFDLDNDRFGSISLPDDYNYKLDLNNGRRALLTLGDRGRSLALVHVCHDHGRIWIRQTTSWAKCFGFNFTLYDPRDGFTFNLYDPRDGFTFNLYDPRDGFTFNLYRPRDIHYPRVLHFNTNGELLLEFSDVLVLINLETKEEKTVQKTWNLGLDAWGYRESLVMLN